MPNVMRGSAAEESRIFQELGQLNRNTFELSQREPDCIPVVKFVATIIVSQPPFSKRCAQITLCADSIPENSEIIPGLRYIEIQHPRFPLEK
jgi:hypothetical protein